MNDKTAPKAQQPTQPTPSQSPTQSAQPTQPTPQQPAPKTELELLREQLAAMTETAKRAMADLINYRKRAEEEKTSLAAFVNTAILLEIIMILDNFERALAAMAADEIPEDHKKGIQSIAGHLTSLLEKYGVKSFDSVSKKFDPAFHEAIAQIPGEKDIILEEIEKGYMTGDKVLRPTKVKVGNGETAAK